MTSCFIFGFKTQKENKFQKEFARVIGGSYSMSVKIEVIIVVEIVSCYLLPLCFLPEKSEGARALKVVIVVVVLSALNNED